MNVPSPYSFGITTVVLPKKPMAITRLGIHEIVYQVSQHIDDIVIHMVHDELKHAIDLETERANSNDSYAKVF